MDWEELKRRIRELKVMAPEEGEEVGRRRRGRLGRVWWRRMGRFGMGIVIY